MAYWIIPSSENVFRLLEYLNTYDVVDWQQYNNFERGDIIFIYNSYPLHRIICEMYVEEVNIDRSRYIDDKDYWRNIIDYELGLEHNRYVRLRLIANAPEDSKLTLQHLRDKGLAGRIQSPRKIVDKKLSYYIRTEIQPETREKIARICWNDKGWQGPSGSNGKSKNNNYESENGYGHEEWLLNRDQICFNGFHYAFLEPLRKSSFEGVRDIHLYTYTPDNKKQYIGCILDAEYVSEKESKKIWREYENRGWAHNMRNELKDNGISVSNNWVTEFNVKFRFEKFIDESDRALFLHKNDINTQNTHYILLNKREPFIFTNEADLMHNDSPDRIIDPNNNIPEGAKLRITVNRYERSRTARTKCVAKHGYACKVCGIDFSKVYGEIGKNYIHVHHIVPISKIGKDYHVDPINDLIPVCPNCHAMLHRGIDGNVLSIDELKTIMKGS